MHFTKLTAVLDVILLKKEVINAVLLDNMSGSG